VEVPLPKMTSTQDVMATPVTPGVKLNQRVSPWDVKPDAACARYRH